MELGAASYHSGIAAVRRAGYRIPRASEDYVEKVMGYVDKSESGSLTPGRENQKEGSRKKYEDVPERSLWGVRSAMFSRTRGEIRRRSGRYRNGIRMGMKISEEEYRRLQKEGEDGLLEESFEENWYVVPYRIERFSEVERKMFDTSYSYRQVTTPKRFLQALEMLKFLAENDDPEAFWETFGWKELVDGGDADGKAATMQISGQRERTLFMIQSRNGRYPIITRQKNRGRRSGFPGRLYARPGAVRYVWRWW